jgi:hypothetical protein
LLRATDNTHAAIAVSVLDQAADRNGSDVAGSWHGLRQGQTDVDQRRSAEVSDV